MNNRTDQQLLREYADARSEAAFAEFVRRYVDFVYSAARRMVRDPHRAEDVTQGVFMACAQQARPLAEHAVLAGWLHRTAQNLAAKAIRTEVRRYAREQEAATMNDLLAGESEAVWEQIAPQLDAALGELSATDRDAVLLRYFQRKSAREMAQVLGTSEEAAQKRVNRAVERLREIFARRGVGVGVAGLVGVIAANAVQAAPVELSITIAGAVSAGSAVLASSAATKTIVMTLFQKTLVVTVVAAAIGTGTYETLKATKLRREVQILNEHQATSAQEIERLKGELNAAGRKLIASQADGERLNRNNLELLRLRSEVAGLRSESRQAVQRTTGSASDPTALAAQAWLNRIKLLRERFESWPGKKTPELELLSEQDWLNEVATVPRSSQGDGSRELDTDEACREAMGRLRSAAKQKFADAVKEALDLFAKSNDGQLPSDLSQLVPYVKPPMGSFFDGYEIAKPGWVHPPKPNAPESDRASIWAIVEKGSFTPGGSYLADPEYDMSVVIYQGGSYRYGVGRRK